MMKNWTMCMMRILRIVTVEVRVKKMVEIKTKEKSKCLMIVDLRLGNRVCCRTRPPKSLS